MNNFFEEVLMDGITDMIFVFKVINKDDFQFQFINKSAKERIGTSKDIIGLSLKEVEKRLDKSEFLYELFRKVAISQTSFTYEDTYEINEERQKTLYFETVLTPLLNKHGLVDRLVAVVRDITKEKETLSSVKEMASNAIENNDRFHSLFFHNTDGIFILNNMGYITDGNEASEKITGYKIEEVVGKSFNTLVELQDIELKRVIDDAINGTTKSYNIIIKNKSGDYVNIIYKIVPLLVDGVVIGLYGILKDVTDLMKNSEKLEESENRFRIIAENANDLITLVNKDGKIIYVSPSYKNVLGYQSNEFLGKDFVHNIHPTDQERIKDVAKKSIQSGEAFTIEFKQKNANEEMLWCESIGKPVFNHKNELQHLVILTRDITLRKEYESKLKYFAYHDALTELPNRILFNKRFASAKKQFSNKNNSLAIVILDIDHFKVINDTYGHDIGDAVIKEFGARIQQSIRSHDTVARMGGDEFVILLPNIQNIENAVEIAKRIKIKMQQPWKIKGQKLTVTTSMGIAMAKFSQKITKSELIKNADIALYEAKNSGRDNYKLYIK
ncbi:sensor domain-containing diguanylate cyclase [Solibacillus sp. A46]|uniref:Sensor domain-containing diguanylate cyclase n=1 Tax=Solibacillus faecavium TaxID=2762221 RepID=A0ABR8XZS7_9BACL|nr:sensor domain-containing diguanylate cyclase [Solibacillus faecavium]MBD8037457.1 sensor domain-containing diguanylate cyclase [Solibacillus faecavium]